MSDATVAAFVFGDDLLVSETVRKITSMFIGDDGDGECVSSSSFEDAVEEMMNPPFFGNKIVAVSISHLSVKCLDRLSSLDIPSTCLMIAFGKSIAADLKKAAKGVGEPTYRMFDFGKAPDFDAATSFVRKRVSEGGGSISLATARSLVSVSGTDLGPLAQEIDKIMVVSKDVTEDHVSKYAFPLESAEYYRFYSYIGKADVANALAEASALVSGYGYEQVDMAIFNVLCTALRDSTTSYTGCVDVKGHRLTESVWWPNGKKKGNPLPSSFMSKIASMISKRHGEDGVKSIMRFARDDMARMRLFPNTRHELFLNMKILALCGRNGAPEIIGSFTA